MNSLKNSVAAFYTTTDGKKSTLIIGKSAVRQFVGLFYWEEINGTLHTFLTVEDANEEYKIY